MKRMFGAAAVVVVGVSSSKHLFLMETETDLSFRESLQGFRTERGTLGADMNATYVERHECGCIQHPSAPAPVHFIFPENGERFKLENIFWETEAKGEGIWGVEMKLYS